MLHVLGDGEFSGALTSFPHLQHLATAQNVRGHACQR